MTAIPIPFSAPEVLATLYGSKTQTRVVSKSHQTGARRYFSSDGFPRLDCICPYGQPGDEVLVREAVRFVDLVDDCAPSKLDPACRVWYEADKPHQPGFGKLRPAMFMPRWASRITLTVTGIRVERLQDISAQDCWAEGIPFSPDTDPRHEYRYLWESIHGADSWEANPWVWVIEFARKMP
jgi:hypothetical protein